MVVLDFLVINSGKISCKNNVILDFMGYYPIIICICRRCESRVILNFPTKWFSLMHPQWQNRVTSDFIGLY